ncbi:ATP cone domain-containing protein [Clostridium sp. HCP1S3_B4]|uniref:ATP cone domain-containing protein n=1 Tax=unclassified Clostridium TaxID=2614128 RepID=UPI0016A79AC2|nr:ATP cone domain-containing protein [Clostridiales bacterium]MDY2729279.1 ATP cone domain-containing protein [Clostridium sp.]NLK23316.1 hypothetical protein [Clostridiales bacterium]
MMIIKKDGRLQDFDENKIKTSIGNAAKSISQAPLNEADIKIISADVVNTIRSIRKNNDNTSSYEIIGVIVDTLKKDGFREVIKEFLSFD